MKKRSKSLTETKLAAKTVLGEAMKRSHKGATVLGLSGDLGSGKTSFTKFLASLLGVKETVQSPTFVIERVYKLLPKTGFSHFVHIDAYRLESSKELASLGFKEKLKDPKNLIVIEWPERVEKLLPEDILLVRFFHSGEKERIIAY